MEKIRGKTFESIVVNNGENMPHVILEIEVLVIPMLFFFFLNSNFAAPKYITWYEKHLDMF